MVLLSFLATGLNFLVSKIDLNWIFARVQAYLSRETLALLNQMESPVDIVITIQEDNELPKVIQNSCTISVFYSKVSKTLHLPKK